MQKIDIVEKHPKRGERVIGQVKTDNIVLAVSLIRREHKHPERISWRPAHA